MKRIIVFVVISLFAALSYAQAPQIIDGSAYYKFGDIFIKQNSGKQQKADFSLRLSCENGKQTGDDCIIEPDPTIKNYDEYIGFELSLPKEKTFFSMALYKGSDTKSAPIHYFELPEDILPGFYGSSVYIGMSSFTLNAYVNAEYVGDALIRSLYVNDIEAYSLVPGQYTFAVTIIREGSNEPETLYKTFNLSYRYENDVLGMFDSYVGIKEANVKGSVIEQVPGTNAYKTKAHRLELIDALGRILKSVECPEKPLTIEEAGAYFLRAREKNGRVAGSKGVVKTR